MKYGCLLGIDFISIPAILKIKLYKDTFEIIPKDPETDFLNNDMLMIEVTDAPDIL